MEKETASGDAVSEVRDGVYEKHTGEEASDIGLPVYDSRSMVNVV